MSAFKVYYPSATTPPDIQGTSSMSNKRVVATIFAVFFIESAVLGNWIPRIPDIKAALNLSDSGLGLCLLAIPMGTLLGLLLAGRVLDRTGLRRGCQIFLPLWALLFVFPPFAPTTVLLSLSLFACGMALGLVEVSMNTEADNIEQRISKRIMSRCHGFWSLGSMAGALTGGLFAHFGYSVSMHFVIVMPLLALVGWFASTNLPIVASGQEQHEDDAPGSSTLFGVPSRAILLLCMMPVGAMIVEGVFIDWSAVFMRSILDASPLVISIGYSFFAVIMAVTRLSGDSLAERFGDLAIIRISGIAAAVGILLFAVAPTVTVAFVAAAISGMGVAIVYPLAVTAAARRPGKSAENVAAITMIGFSAFLVAPPVIGFLSDWLGMRWALALLTPLALSVALLAPEVRKNGASVQRSGSQ